MRIARLLAAASAAAVLAVLTGSPAWAHNSLTDASPAENATLKEAPQQVKLTFLQRIDPALLTIVVTDAGKRQVPTEGPKANGKVGTLAFSEPLANGAYTVAYRVTSLDGHPVRGSYTFTVEDPSATSAPAPPSTAPSASTASSAPGSPAAPDTMPASAESGGPGRWPMIAGIALVVALVTGALFAMRRRANRPL